MCFSSPTPSQTHPVAAGSVEDFLEHADTLLRIMGYIGDIQDYSLLPIAYIIVLLPIAYYVCKLTQVRTYEHADTLLRTQRRRLSSTRRYPATQGRRIIQNLMHIKYWLYTYIYMCIVYCTHTNICLFFMCIYFYVYVYINIYIYIYISYISCIHIYVYIYTYIYIHMYIHVGLYVFCACIGILARRFTETFFNRSQRERG